MKVRVRFAPSPTGWLHVGGARTALYNFLFARQHNGTFILRIEDTDRTRSTEEAIQAIIEDMKWLGLNWDEGPDVGGGRGPYRQTEREQLYRQHIDRLIESGNAYYCFCLPEELDRMRQEARRRGESFRYPRRCRSLTPEQQEELRAENPRPAVRFKTPETGELVVNDLVKGEIRFDLSQLDDFIIARSDGTATYNLAVVVDDALMGVTHVIRGDDHLSNTPKQILIYRALGYELPEFAHLSMILGPDKKPLSKRHGATAVFEFRNRGYLPEALVNYLALLGWSYDDRTTVFSLEELIEKFSLERVSANPAVFDMAKLEWLNGVRIRYLPVEELANRILPFVREAYGHAGEIVVDRNFLFLVEITRERLRFLTDFVDWTYFYFTPEEQFELRAEDAERVFKNREESEAALRLAREKLAEISSWEVPEIERALRSIPEETGSKARKVFQPIRLAVTGRLVSPPLFESIRVLGREKTLGRIDRALKQLTE